MAEHGGRHERDRGFTLVELVTIVAIVGFVMTAITAAMIIFLRNSDDLEDKLDASHSAQLTTRYLPSDLQSVAPGGATTSGFIPVCGITPDVLVLAWTDLSTTPSTRYDAIYHVNGNELRRSLCIDGAVVQSNDLAHNVSSAVATLTADKVELQITTASTEADPTGYVYSIFGIRRT